MTLSVDYLYQFILKLIRKNQAGGLTSNEFQLHWNDAQGSYQDDLLGRFQMRSNGKTGANTGLISDETILQKLAPFTKNETIDIIDAKVLKPTDFIYRLGFRIEGEDVIKINPSQISNVNNSVLDAPSVADNKYFFTEYENYYSILPSTLPTAGVTTSNLDFIITPPNIIWGFTVDSNGREVYNSGTSVQSMWDNNSNREITKRVLVNLGVSFKDNDFTNFGKSVQLTGE